MGMFDDLVPPQSKTAAGGMFDDLIPKAAPAAPAPPSAAMQELSTAFQEAVVPQEPGMLETIMSDYVEPAVQTAGYGAQELLRGGANLAGLPVDMVNASPMLMNLLPGEQGFKPFTETPIGGSENLRDTLNMARDVAGGQEIKATGPGQRVFGRIMEEVGASAIPIGAAARLAQKVGGPVARGLKRLIGREVPTAVAAGSGAQVANEIYTPEGAEPGSGNGWSDLAGSFLGGGAYPIASGLGGMAKNFLSSATGNRTYASDIVKESLADAYIDNWGDARNSSGVPDTEALSRRLETPTALESRVPDYKAGVGERSGDAGIMTLQQKVEGKYPAISNQSRIDNTAAINSAVDARAPTGNAGNFREGVAASAQTEITSAVEAAEEAQKAFDSALLDASPTMELGTRGAVLRDELRAVRDAELKRVADMFAKVDGSNTPVDLARLKERFAALTKGLQDTSLNDANRFLPPETGTVAALPDTGPVSQAGSVRSGLADTMRTPGTTPREANIAGRFKDETDEFMRAVMPPEEVALLDDARNLRADLGRRFEEPDAVGRSLSETGRGVAFDDAGNRIGDSSSGYQLPDEAIPSALVPSDKGKITDYGRMMKEVGASERAREAVADQIISAAQTSNALKTPESLTKFLTDRKIVLADFPDVRAKLEAAGASKATLDATAKASKETTRLLSPGGPSATGQYTRFGKEDPVSSMNTVLSADRPDEAMRELLGRAGGNPKAVEDARTAAWSWLRDKGTLAASDGTGQARWDAKKMRDLLSGEGREGARVQAALRELYPGQEFEDIKELSNIFTEMEAAIPGRMTAPGMSGTAQALAAKEGSSLSARRISADIRAATQNRTSPTQVAIGWASDGLRNLSVAFQRKWIDQMLEESTQNPAMVAKILREFNPADIAASKKRINSVYGLRANGVSALLESLAGNDDDALTNTIMEDQ